MVAAERVPQLALNLKAVGDAKAEDKSCKRPESSGFKRLVRFAEVAAKPSAILAKLAMVKALSRTK